ncbi:MAG: methyltransferase domain-containing protein [Polyangiales bacterium]
MVAATDLSPLKIGAHRARTMARALRSLYTLPQRDIDAFMNSYVRFDGDWSKDNGKREAHIVDYYRVLNHLCALGNVEKMYIPPLIDRRAGVLGNQVLFERKMCRDLNLAAGHRVLDIGCGRGRIAAHVATHTGARVTGLNIDPTQVDSARQFAEMSGLSGRAEFLRGSFNDPLPFGDEAFDAAYQVQAFTYARDLRKVFAEVFRVLRPGARFSYLDWVTLPGYDPENPRHVELMNKARFLIGGVDAPTPEQVIEAMTAVGFELVLQGDPSENGHQADLIKAEDRYFRMAKEAVDRLVAIRLFPPHFSLLFERFTRDADAFIACDELGLATTTYQIVVRRPALD